ncbi:Putative multidrug export ATP-binding/permease protein SAV1866 [Slackia heliotrinireducens]|uniref:Cysteine export CydDC family ABC transporter permease subunit/ATP-binding protein CydC n=1 Tax=Slackia heliotrinireducens (strain ATCC 29202 / DSM 20476 / NCTC 11029 / RHS 1) TaxID=471855 RepID=C7N652_SLAHD|nr:thiol reductant ABC exporter subunit CydC [Slackia heliotrinireducens]ACV22387.1 cysteine export CydDC family ABC transporter permease subunit/ATP-binding protein CydC [Slackia heliotrinireducens DSM 20476]VEH00687.1 Putative multidrug export ATP-binding/permease protein SAV1866 [Slackia heliotrinireducens]
MSRSEDRWVRPYFSKYRKPLVAALFLGVVTYVAATMLMFESGYAISATGERPEGGVLTVFIPIVIVQVCALGKPVTHYFERLFSHDWVFRMTSDMRRRLYDVIERNAVRMRGTHRTGDYLGYIAEDIGHVQNLYLRTIFPTVIAWLVYALLIAALGLFDIRFALAMALILAATCVLLPLASMLVNRARIERRKSLRSSLYGDLADNVLGATDWVFSGRSGECQGRTQAAAAQERAVQASLNRYERGNNLVLSIVFAIGVCVVLVWAGGGLGYDPGIEANYIAAFALGFFPLIDAFTPLSPALTQVNIYRDTIDRLNALPPEELRRDCGKTPASADMHVDGVGFSYPGTERLVLNQVSLHIPAGQKVAILGRSGSGKSTLASLIRGEYAPDTGSVCIGGVPTFELSDALTQYIGVIQQNPYLFNKTLRDNLKLGNPEATDEQVLDALERVHLGGLVAGLPDGLDTMVDEAGKRFSGGERHRIAIARILLANTPVVLLDEPTVGLDPITEQALLETLFETCADRTLIMITHHLQGADMFDRIVFIEDGALAMDGSPAHLAATEERYRNLLAFDRGL